MAEDEDMIQQFKINRCVLHQLGSNTLVKAEKDVRPYWVEILECSECWSNILRQPEFAPIMGRFGAI